MSNTRKSPPGWEVVDGDHLSKTWTFPDFAQALEFVNRVGAVAEAADHHPDVFLAWGKVRLDVTTHSAKGLTDKDYDLAARIEAL